MQYFLHKLSVNETVAKEQDPTFYNLVLVAQCLQTFYVPVLTILGLISNAVCCAVLLMPKLRKQPTSVYLTAICISDILFLVVLFLTWLKSTGVDLINTGGWCQAIKYFSSITAFLALWNMVAMATDRMIYCCFPLQRSSMCTATRAKVVTMSLCIAAIPIYLNISILSGIMHTKVGPLCVLLPQFTKPFQILIKLDITFNVFTPYLALIAFTLVIVHWIVKTRGQKVPLNRHPIAATATDAETGQNSGPDLQSAILVVAVTCTCMVLSMPSHVMQLWVMFNTFLQSSYRPDKLTAPWQQILLHMFYTRCAVTLYVCLAVSGSFRSTLGKLVLLLKKKHRRGRYDAKDNSLREALHPDTLADTPTQSDQKDAS